MTPSRTRPINGEFGLHGKLDNINEPEGCLGGTELMERKTVYEPVRNFLYEAKMMRMRGNVERLVDRIRTRLVPEPGIPCVL